ncbi:hypothetical protein EVA_09007 [gut metagenome]|uniref:Uncharacterized protein n=1 Tax=gut metagenome TaxID=749906 RepID=J9CRR9_9ZZZZ
MGGLLRNTRKPCVFIKDETWQRSQQPLCIGVAGSI